MISNEYLSGSKFREIMSLGITITLVLALILPIGLCLSEPAELAGSRLNESRLVIAGMESENISAQMPKDLYLEAEQIYQAQVALEKAKGTPDYTLVYKRADEINSISKRALYIKDELNALKSRIEESPVNVSLAKALYAEAIKEFEDERYDACEDKLAKAYESIFEQESAAARLTAAYEAMSRSVESYLRANYRIILAVLSILAISLLLMRPKIRRYLLERKLLHLETRKKILIGLTAKAQRDYFEKKTLGEDTYKIRITKFAELIRDINRQILLIKMQLERAKNKPEDKSSKSRI